MLQIWYGNIKLYNRLIPIFITPFKSTPFFLHLSKHISANIKKVQHRIGISSWNVWVLGVGVDILPPCKYTNIQSGDKIHNTYKYDINKWSLAGLHTGSSFFIRSFFIGKCSENNPVLLIIYGSFKKGNCRKKIYDNTQPKYHDLTLLF